MRRQQLMLFPIPGGGSGNAGIIQGCGKMFTTDAAIAMLRKANRRGVTGLLLNVTKGIF
jgi:hypothetical protein